MGDVDENRFYETMEDEGFIAGSLRELEMKTTSTNVSKGLL